MVNQIIPGDDELIPRLLANDETAYRQVVKAYHGMMIHLARTIVGEAIADEVAQEAWVAVIRALPKFERRSSLKTWIMRIVSNCAKSRLRHESRTINFENPIDETEPLMHSGSFSASGSWNNPPKTWHAETPEQLLASRQTQDSIDLTLRTLPALQQAVVTLRDIQGLDMDSICKILEITESNARVLLHRARTKIYDELDNLQEA